MFFSEELGYWVVSRYEDIQAIFKDPATFSSENTQAPFKPRPPEVAARLRRGRVSRTSSGLSGRQPPDHTRLRGFINKAFTPRRIAALEPQVRELAVDDDRRASRSAATPISSRSWPTSCPRWWSSACSACRTTTCPQVKEWAASRVLPELRRPARSTSRSHHAENLVRLLALLRGAGRAAASSEPRDDLPGDLARIYREGDQSITTRGDRRPGPHAAVRRARDDDGAAGARPEGAARAARRAGRSCAAIRS